MGYSFQDFGTAPKSAPMSLRSIVSGIELDKMAVEGFTLTTLSVKGRGSVEYEVEATDIAGREGALQRRRQLKPRSLVIRLIALGKTNEAYRKGLTALNAHLYSTELHTIRFTDDVDHTYYGTVVKVDDGDERTNRQVLEIEFVCNDPFKYTASKKLTITGAVPLTVETDVPLIADEYSITFNSPADASKFALVNNNSKKRISFAATVKDSTVIIRQKKNYIGTSTTNVLSGLNIKYSDFDDFTVRKGDVIWTSPAAKSIEITYRGKRL